MEPVNDHNPASRNYSRLMTGQEYTFSSSNVASREPDELVEEVRKNVIGEQQVCGGRERARESDQCGDACAH